MGFLSGWFIAGIAAVAAPILFHMIRRTPSGKVPFSTLMFLQPSPPRITKRSRIDQWPLLLLRALALTLLALAFARPFLRSVETNVTEAAQERQIAVLLDRSASMQRAGVWQDAQLRVVDAFAAATDADQMALYAFDNRTEAIMTFQEWKELEPSTRREILVQRLEKITPGWGSTDLGAALVLAADDIESLEMEGDDKSETKAASSVLLISDIQQGSAIESLQNYEWPDTIELAVQQVAAAGTTNAGLELMAQSDVDVDQVRVRVSNASDSESEEFTIKWTDNDGESLKEPQPVYVAPGRSRIVSFEPPSGIGSSQLILAGDAHEFDNKLYLDRLDATELSVLYLGKEEENDPESLRFYLTRAFPQTPSRTVRMIPPQINDVDTPIDPTISMVVVANQVEGKRLPELRKYMQDGGTVLYVAQTADGVATVAPLLSDNQEFAAVEADVKEYALVEQVDYTHPVFAPFADAQFADFTRIHCWKHRTLPTSALGDARILARFDDGDPAIVEKSLGRGRLLVFATGWQPSDSQLALSTKFVPLMNGILEQAESGPMSLPRMQIGDELRLAPFRSPGQTKRFAVTKPDGGVVELKDDDQLFTETSDPGVYELDTGDGSARFAVNVNPDETDTSVMPLEQLESLGVKMMDINQSDPANIAAAEARERQLKIQELEKQQKLWRWLVIAAIALLFIETWLAGRIASKQSTGEATSLQGGTA
jgi:hypothetical protein